MTFWDTWHELAEAVQVASSGQIPMLYMTEFQLKEFCERTGAEYTIEMDLNLETRFLLRYRNVVYSGILLDQHAGINSDVIYLTACDNSRPPRVMFEGTWSQERISDLFVKCIDPPVEDDIRNIDSIL